MQRYFASGRSGNKIILEDSDLRHIKVVMRMNISDKIECVYDKHVYLCQIDSLDGDISILEEIEEKTELDTEIIVAVGLVKEQKMDLILQKLTELGVSRIIPLNMDRSIVKLDKDRWNKKKVRWMNICKEASEQAHRLKVPVIDDIMSLKELEKIEASLKFVCSVREEKNLVNKYLQNNNKCATMLFVIGPEGGITEKEEQLLNDIGCVSISLGPRVMRVETAAIYVASIANFYCMG